MGELLVRYVTVESDDGGEVLAFIPVYVGSNLNFNALLPKLVQQGYNALVRSFGTAVATRVAVIGCLISDRGWVPMRPSLTDRNGAFRLLLGEIDRVAKQHSAQLGMLKDIHCDFPAEERALMREAGFVEGFSLPTTRINTDYDSFAEYLKKSLSKNGRRLASKRFKKAEGNLTLSVFEDFEHLIPRVFPLYRAVFLKAKYQFEELPPRFYVECSRSTSPQTEMVLCETNDGRLVGSMFPRPRFYHRPRPAPPRPRLRYVSRRHGPRASGHRPPGS